MQIQSVGIDLRQDNLSSRSTRRCRQGDCAEEVQPEASSGLYRERPGISDWT
jgi:hypothetical protein